MLKLNRTTEYGLMALSYIRNKNAKSRTDGSIESSGSLTSAREIADHYSLPFEILAKTLQKLKEQGIIASTYGTRGGYLLARDLKSLNLADFVGMMEGPISVVNCTNHATKAESSCEYKPQCTIKTPMAALNAQIYEFLNRISVEELTRQTAQAQTESLSFGEEP